MNTLNTLFPLWASRAGLTLRAYGALRPNITRIAFYALRALRASHAHRGRIIQSAIVSPANDALARNRGCKHRPGYTTRSLRAFWASLALCALRSLRATLTLRARVSLSALRALGTCVSLDTLRALWALVALRAFWTLRAGQRLQLFSGKVGIGERIAFLSLRACFTSGALYTLLSLGASVAFVSFITFFSFVSFFTLFALRPLRPLEAASILPFFAVIPVDVRSH